MRRQEPARIAHRAAQASRVNERRGPCRGTGYSLLVVDRFARRIHPTALCTPERCSACPTHDYLFSFP